MAAPSQIKGSIMDSEIVRMAHSEVTHWASNLVTNYRAFGTSHIEVDVKFLEEALDKLHRRNREQFEKVLQRSYELTADTAV